MLPKFSEIICNFVRMNRKEIIQSIISIMQQELPFEVIERDIQLPIDSNQIITVSGVRRCGKSSVMKLVANQLIRKGVRPENILWINFDDERLDGMKAEDLDTVLTAYREMFPDIPLDSVYMFFDEIQYVDKWELFIIRLYKTYCKNIYITGSNSQMLSGHISTALRGWPLEFVEFPLSFHEYLTFKNIKTDFYSERGRAILYSAFKDYLFGSSFPEIVLMNEKSMQIQKIQGYFNTMLMRDLSEYHQFSHTSVFRYFLKRIMGDLTKPTSVNKIYNDIKSQGNKVDKNRLYEIAESACDIFLLFRVNKWTKSLIEENNKLPKYYLIDNGMRNAIIMPQSNDMGKLLENAVFLQLKRRCSPFAKIFYYSQGVECDFVVQEETEITHLIQVCWDISSEETLHRELRGLKAASQATGCRNCCIITMDESREFLYEDLSIKVYQAWKWFLRDFAVTM